MFLSPRLCSLIPISYSISALNRVILPPIINSTQIRNYAARKGTRERKKKAKVKVEVKKIGFIPHNLRNKEKLLASRVSKKSDDSSKKDPIDDVYALKHYKWIVYPFAEAIKAHRETHHPEMYNKPNAEVHVTVELNMQGEKKTRFVDDFKRIAAIHYPYDHGEERTIIAFAKNEESQQEAAKAGAQLSGGGNLIKEIQNGQVLLQDFQHIIAHPDILPELVVLRGILKRRFPSPKLGTLDINLKEVVDRFMHGISYQAIKDEYEKDFGQVNAILGTLNMDEKHLEENFASLVNDIYSQKPKRSGSFITRCLLWSPPSREKLKVDHEIYVTHLDSSSKKKENDEDVEEQKIAL